MLRLLEKKPVLLMIDAALLYLSAYVSYLVKFYPDVHFWPFLSMVHLLVISRIILFLSLDLYNCPFRLIGFRENVRILIGVLIGSLFTYSFLVFFDAVRLIQFIVIEFLMTCFLFIVFRSLYKVASIFRKKPENTKRVVVVGAGEAGESIARSMQLNPSAGYYPIGFIDDDPKKKRKRLSGLKIYGDRYKIPSLVKKRNVDEIVVSIPTASGDQMRDILGLCAHTTARVKVLPCIWDIINGEARLSQLRDFSPEDLLGRVTVKVDLEKLRETFQRKTILVTGACGSIGREILHQLEELDLKCLVAVDRDETGIFYLKYRHSLEANAEEKDFIKSCVADITDKERMDEIFDEYRPDIVLHAAAYKHVSLMEESPREVVRNNILGTLYLTELAKKYAVSSFVLISTDKAVKPINLMGLSKRIAELIVKYENAHSQTKFSTVRFGNVLASNGSLIPIIQKQIQNKREVTITDARAKRFFMTTPEAVQLILQSLHFQVGGEIFVLDMGEQVEIEKVVRQIIALSGFRAEDEIKIRYTGLRPGEKLTEELSEKDEKKEPTDHPRIYRQVESSILSDSFLDVLQCQLNNWLHLSREEQLQDSFRQSMIDFIEAHKKTKPKEVKA